MSSNTIQPFNALSPNNGADRQHHVAAQETIYYGESRFRQILITIAKETTDRQRWLQSRLHRELVGDLYFPTPLAGRLTYTSYL